MRRFEEHFDSDEQSEIRTIVDAFTFANRFYNSWEPWLPGAVARRRWLGMRAPEGGDPACGSDGDPG